MKKYVKIVIFIILIVFCLFNFAYAADDTYTPSFTPDKLTGEGGKTDEIEEKGNNILSVVSLIGSGISVIAIIALGIKYMLGSVEEKAEYKKTLLPYFIGAIFVFGATLIPGIVYDMFN